MMRKFFVVGLVVLVGIVLISASVSIPGRKVEDIRYPQKIEKNGVKTSVNVKMDPDFGKIPLYFIPNKGQVHEKARFYARTSRYSLWMTKQGLVFDSMRQVGIKAEVEEIHLPHSPYLSHSPESLERDVSRVIFLNANTNPEMMPVEMTQHKVNYFIGKDSSRWKKGISTSKAVLYKNIYKNIDLKVYGNERQIEYDWIVKPGGNPGDIGFEYKNVKATRIDSKGNLVVEARFGKLIHKQPVSYQQLEGNHIGVQSQFRKISNNTYGFAVKAYDKNYELIIDPVVSLVYSTYLGGSGGDEGYSIEIDNNGNIYLGGYTNSNNFPTKNPYHGPKHGCDIFVTKLNANGSELLYSTYLGGNSGDICYDIALSADGTVYLTGYSNSSDFPASNNSAGYSDVIISVLDNDGSLTNSRYLGASSFESGYGIAIDNLGYIYVTGSAESGGFPMLNPYQEHMGINEAFVSILNPNDLELVYSTYLGGTDWEFGFDIDVDASGSFYVIGTTGSKNFPLKNPYQNTIAGYESSIFITKFKPDGSDIVYSTYLGGSSEERAGSIFVDDLGYTYVSGLTYSVDFPTKNAYIDTLQSGSDIFVSKFNQDGSSLVYSTYLGGAYTTHNVLRSDIAVDHSGCVFVATATRSTDFPVKNPIQCSNAGGLDALVCKLSADGSSLIYATYLGGTADDRANSIALGPSGNVYITGTTFSPDFPTVNPYQDYYAGAAGDLYHGDVIVSRLSYTYLIMAQCITNTGVPITVAPADINGYGSGNTDFTRTYEPGEVVTLTAPETFNNKVFYKWIIDGVDNLNLCIQVTINSNHTVTAVYQTPPSNYALTVRSTPHTGVPITVTPNDINGNGDGKTSFARLYSSGEIVELTAPKTFNDKAFGKWTVEGQEYFNRKIMVTMGGDFTASVKYQTPAVILLSRTHLYFGASTSGITTNSQTFFISKSGESTLNWSITDNASWLNCNPASGTDAGEVNVSIDVSGLSPGTYTGVVTVSDPNAANSPQTIGVTLTVYSAAAPGVPFGYFETPHNGVTVMSSIPVTGWALDDIGVECVKIYREENKNLVYVGDAAFVEGARPDVELAYSNYPNCYKAGWGYMMLTNFLPNGGNGTFVIHAIASDKEGNQVTLGTKTIHCDNANTVKPFGAIDTPSQGGTVSGSSYVNFGWVLTPQPNYIPTDGSTINVWIDGVNVGNPVYNNYRADIAVLFPGYANSNGAVGYFYFDTTQYENGVHTIQWTAVDSAGNVDGIGSRYFMIRNTGENRTQETFTGQRSVFNVDITQIPVDYSQPVLIKKDVKENIKYKTIYPNHKGITTTRIKELQRVEIHVFGHSSEDGKGFQLVGDRLCPLPIGSTFDAERGVFYWLPGPGFIGTYRLVFIEEKPNGEIRKKFINIKIVPKFKRR
jgi:hypothetical protein